MNKNNPMLPDIIFTIFMSITYLQVSDDSGDLDLFMIFFRESKNLLPYAMSPRSSNF